MKNFNNYKFHASSIGMLMTEPKTKKDKEAGLFSATAKAYLLDIAIEVTYGRKKQIETDAMRKGTEMEQVSIDMLSELHKYSYEKNNIEFENDYLIGTPDIIDGDTVIDVKTCQDIFTFTKKHNIPKIYQYQLYAYNLLTNTSNGKIVYVLPNSPQWMIEKEFSMKTFYQPEELWQEIEEDIEKKHIFDDIPLERRIKEYDQKLDNEIVETLYSTIDRARNYLNNIVI